MSTPFLKINKRLFKTALKNIWSGYLNYKSEKKTVILIAALQTFNGLSGLLGGFLLIYDRSGKSLNMDRQLLTSTPFHSFLIPGIVLFILVGVANFTGFLLTLGKYEKAPAFAIVSGIILMLWISAQVLWIGFQGSLQPLYFCTGLLQLIVGMFLRRTRPQSPNKRNSCD